MLGHDEQDDVDTLGGQARPGPEALFDGVVAGVVAVNDDDDGARRLARRVSPVPAGDDATWRIGALQGDVGNTTKGRAAQLPGPWLLVHTHAAGGDGAGFGHRGVDRISTKPGQSSTNQGDAEIDKSRGRRCNAHVM